MTDQIQDQDRIGEDCPYCDGDGYYFDGYTGQSLDCSRCAGTGIKDFASKLPNASLEATITELKLSQLIQD